ncbi:MAG: DnaJ like chaperone protein [Crocinitomicaceae bacterium]|jgi:DnaJ like chaperone protein
MPLSNVILSFSNSVILPIGVTIGNKEVGIVFLAIVGVLLIFRITNKIKEEGWKSILENSSSNEIPIENVLHAYIYLGAYMIKADRKASKDKVVYMSKYLREQFHGGVVDFIGTMNDAFNSPLPLERLIDLLNTALKKHERDQVIYFLAGICLVDGLFDKKEVDLLKNISFGLGLSKKEFDSIKAIYKQKEQRSRYQSSSSRPKSVSAKKSILNTAHEVLGVSEHASMDEVKKAYRSLVKKHHPDIFATDSIEQQNIAEERFLEIQKSYEMIEKYK